MRTPAPRTVAALVAAALTIPATGAARAATAPDPAPDATAGVLPIRLHGERAGAGSTLPQPPAHLSVEDRADWILDEVAVGGRAPREWIGWARAHLADPPPAATLGRPGADLTGEVLRTWALVGLEPSAADRAAIAEAAAGLHAAVAGPFASLVAATNDVYAAQMPIAAAVATRLAAGNEPATLLTTPERDLMAAGQQRLVAAVDAFAAAAGPHMRATSSSAPLFSDPEGLVVLGGTGADTYVPAGALPDPVLLVDPAGADVYRNRAGGACPLTPESNVSVLRGRWLDCNGLAVSVVADLGTDGAGDQYLFDGPPSVAQGAGGPGGIGVLIDVAGDDRYEARMTRGQTPYLATYYIDGGAQGFGYAGAGLLADRAGNDSIEFAVDSTHGHSIWAFAHGFGAAGGLGTALDLGGDDTWQSLGLGLESAFGFEGIYTDGSGFYGGVGMLLDLGGGDDTYLGRATARTTDYYAQGFGAFGGLGILYEDGGDDDYTASETATNPWIDPLLNCAFGTGSFGGIGVMIEVAGDDRYLGVTESPKSTSIMDYGGAGPGSAFGVFVDGGGTDHYRMVTRPGPGRATMVTGYGHWEPALGGDLVNAPFGHNLFAAFVDVGGHDTYEPALTGVGNDRVWLAGVDRRI